MTVSTIGAMIAIIAFTALLEVVDKEGEAERKAFESDEVERS